MVLNHNDWRTTEQAMNERRGIYIASKTTHAERWRALRTDGLPIVSTWIDEAGLGESASLADLWRRNVLEAANAAALIVYHEPGETPKGALVEIGAAIACGVPVLWVGPQDGQTVVCHALTCAERKRRKMMRRAQAAPVA